MQDLDPGPTPWASPTQYGSFVRHRASLWLLVATCGGLHALPAALAAERASEYSVDIIVEGMRATQAQLVDLRLDYVMNQPVTRGPEPAGTRVTNGTYARTLVDGAEYLARQSQTIDPATNTVKQDNDDDVTVFDGQKTVWFNRRLMKTKRFRAMIHPGLKKDQFPRIDPNPCKLVWCFGDQPYPDLIEQNKTDFAVQGTEEINGVETVKLVGTIWAGAGKMTFWISPSRSFLPMKVHVLRHKDNRLLSELFLEKLVELPNGIWYPQSFRFGSPSPEHCCRCAISDVSVDPIPKDFFHLKLPPNTVVYDYVLNMKYIVERETSGQPGMDQIMQEIDGGVRQNPNAAEKDLQKYLAEAQMTERQREGNTTRPAARADLPTSNYDGAAGRPNEMRTRAPVLAVMAGAGLVILIVLIVSARAFQTRRHESRS